MRTIIIEDNHMDQLILEKLIGQDDELELVGKFENAVHAISSMRNINPDLIFLDVELPRMSGIEFLQAIKKVPQIIMITSHSKFALDAFENDVTDFIVKPVMQDRFEKAIEKAKQMHEWLSLEPGEDAHIYVRVDRENVKINLNEILYIEALGDYVRIQLESAKHLVLSTMKALETKLDESIFVRNHRSFLTNISKIDSFTSTTIKIDDKEIPISRTGLIEMKQHFSKKTTK